MACTLLGSSGAPTNSSSTSMTRCRNSRTSSGSTSWLLGTRKRRFAWTTLKTEIGGEHSERYKRDGLGAGWARKRESSEWAGRGRPR